MNADLKWNVGETYWLSETVEGNGDSRHLLVGMPVELLAVWDLCLFVKTADGKIHSVRGESLAGQPRG